MREIKFRAWSKERETMIHADENGWYHKAFIGKNGFWQTTQLDTIIKNAQIIPLQYTGLKDKNGKEIYEGDIVKSKNHSGGDVSTNIDSIVFESGAFVVRDKDRILDDMWIGDKDIYDIEVIGNIYENPELLEQAS